VLHYFLPSFAHISPTLLQLEFKQQHGHCDVPQTYALNPKLGVWVNKVSLFFCFHYLLLYMHYSHLSSLI
jgi:hypothetical protein